MALFRPPKFPADTPSGLRETLIRAFAQIFGDLKGLSQGIGDATVAFTTYQATAGESKRVSPPAAGMGFVLPSPASENRGARVSVFLEQPEGDLRVFVAPNATADATVNGQEMVTFSTEGLVVFESNGVNRWNSTEAFSSASPGTAALDASYVLGAAHASLPNGRVATDSAEVDADLTVANVISWALNAASVVFAKLQNIATQRIVGRNTAGTGSPEQITVHQALDWIVGDEWGFDGSDDAVSMGNVLQYERNNTFSGSAWIKTGLPGLSSITDFVIISNGDSTANNRGWAFYVHNDGKPHLKLANVINSNDLDIAGEANVCNGQLHHLAFTYSGGSAPASVQLYLNGVALTKTTVINGLSATIVAAGNSLRIGRFGANASLFFPGVIRHVSTWDVALSGANVTTIYNSGTPGDLSAVAFVSNLDAWWKLDGTDTTAASGVNDYGPSNFDGTAEGGLTNGVRQGALLARGATDWDILQPGAKGAALISTGGNTVPSFGSVGISIQYDDTVTGTLDPYLLPSTFKSGDALVWVITGNVTLNRIRMSDNSIPPDGMVLYLSLRDQSGGAAPGFSITIVDTGAVSVDGSFRTPGQVQGTSPGPSYVMQSEEEGSTWLIRAGNWRCVGGTAAQAIDGDITVASGNGSTRTAAITAGVIVNADINGSAAIALSKLATQAANTVVANATAGSAVPTAVAVGANTVLGRVAGNIVAAALVNAQVDAAAAIAVSKLANAAALTVLTNATNGSAAHTDVAATAASDAVFRESGSALGFGTVATGGLANAIITPAKLAVIASGIGALFTIFTTATAGTPGSADDVTIYNANAPFAFRILDVIWLDSTAIALSTVQLRDTSGGGGAALSSALTAAVTGTARNNDSQTRTVASGGSVFLRRSDQGVAGEVIIYAVRT